jgi:two-component system sensor histidine kinase HydH
LGRIRGIDIVWLAFLGAIGVLVLTEQDPSPWEWLALAALGMLQIFEGRLGWTATTKGAVVVTAAKLGLCYLLVWQTGGIESNYYLIFVLPIISAASIFGPWLTVTVTVATAALYLSLVLILGEGYYVPDDGQRELATRVLFFFAIAVLVNRFASENRWKTESLSKANRELSAAQDEVRRSERLAALGQLSAGLAHEIRNPLGVIQASSELLKKNISDENQLVHELSGYIGSEVARTNLLVTRFLDFARPAQAHREIADLNAVVGSAVAQAEESIRNENSPVTVTTLLGEIKPFAIDVTLIESCILNLLLNARDSMPDGGVIAVETGVSDGNASVLVRDEGCGIPAESLEEIFNPFFTTRAEGVGLGLAMVSNFVDSHGGRIHVTSEPGEGTTFRILLPLEDNA